MKFDPQAEQILVPGLIQGPLGKVRRVRFLVDTGTSHSVFDAPLTDEIGFGARLAVGTSRLWGVGGVSVGYVVRAPRVRVLGREIQDYKIAIHDLGDELGVEALLGLDFFKGCFLGIDFRDGAIRVET